MDYLRRFDGQPEKETTPEKRNDDGRKARGATTACRQMYPCPLRRWCRHGVRGCAWRRLQPPLPRSWRELGVAGHLRLDAIRFAGSECAMPRRRAPSS